MGAKSRLGSVGWVADARSGGFLKIERTKQKNETQHTHLPTIGVIM